MRRKKRRLPADLDFQMTEPIYAMKVLIGEIKDEARRNYKPPIKDESEADSLGERREGQV